MISLDTIAPKVRTSQAAKKATVKARKIIDSANDFVDLKMSEAHITDLKKVKEFFLNKLLPKSLRKRTEITYFGTSKQVKQKEIFKGENRLSLEKFAENGTLTYKETFSPKEGKLTVEDFANNEKLIIYNGKTYYSKRPSKNGGIRTQTYDPKTDLYTVTVKEANQKRVTIQKDKNNYTKTVYKYNNKIEEKNVRNGVVVKEIRDGGKYRMEFDPVNQLKKEFFNIDRQKTKCVISDLKNNEVKEIIKYYSSPIQETLFKSGIKVQEKKWAGDTTNWLIYQMDFDPATNVKTTQKFFEYYIMKPVYLNKETLKSKTVEDVTTGKILKIEAFEHFSKFGYDCNTRPTFTYDFNQKTGVKTSKKYDYKAGRINIIKEKDDKTAQRTYDLNGNRINSDGSFYWYKNIDEQNAEWIKPKNGFKRDFGGKSTGGKSTGGKSGGSSTGSTGSSTGSTGSRTTGRKWNTGDKTYTKEYLQNLEYITELTKQKRFSVSRLVENDIRIIADLLEITPEQVRDLDKATYRKLMIKYHPDKNPGNEVAEELCKLIGIIYKN